MTYTVVPLPALDDNYIWMIIHPNTRNAVAVDPGDAQIVHTFLSQHQLSLQAIILTHHHRDHTDGVQPLVSRTHAPVYGPAHPALACVTHPCQALAHITIEALSLRLAVLPVPGHTLTHLAYFAPGMLFSGDTLFCAGCGRLFEGTPAQMHESLTTLAQLPADTRVYCTHEYTLDNLAFAHTVEPNNPKIKQKIAEVKALRACAAPSLPSTLGEELAINPFLRCHLPLVKTAAQAHAKTPLDTDTAVFATLRAWKDTWRAP